MPLKLNHTLLRLVFCMLFKNFTSLQIHFYCILQKSHSAMGWKNNLVLHCRLRFGRKLVSLLAHHVLNLGQMIKFCDCWTDVGPRNQREIDLHFPYSDFHWAMAQFVCLFLSEDNVKWRVRPKEHFPYVRSHLGASRPLPGTLCYFLRELKNTRIATWASIHPA